jgi:hypothetical protein
VFVVLRGDGIMRNGRDGYVRLRTDVGFLQALMSCLFSNQK